MNIIKCMQELEEQETTLSKLFIIHTYIIDDSMDEENLVLDDYIEVQGLFALNEYILEMKQYFKDSIMFGYGHVDVCGEGVDFSVSLL